MEDKEGYITMWDNWSKRRASIPVYDNWLDEYQDILSNNKDNLILDLGCGIGADTLYLIEKGFKVLSCDFSNEALKSINKNIKGSKTKYINMLNTFPFKNEEFSLIIADLSLHYFNDLKTKQIMKEIKRILKKDGILLARVASIHDYNFGAGMGDEIEKNFYFEGSYTKRFFDEEDTYKYFGIIGDIEISETSMTRDEEEYSKEKILYQIKVIKNNLDEICPTALITSFPRTLTNIPYEKEINNWLTNHQIKCPNNYQDLAPEIEARYKLINKILDNSNIKQVLELASGYSSRGLNYSQKGYNYVELDLEIIMENKRKMINDLNNHNLILESGNALNEKDMNRITKYMDKNELLAIINEGLLRYLSFPEKKQVAKNIYNLLNIFGGIWITSDVTPKSFIASQDKALPSFNQNLSNITNRNNLEARFDDIDHVKAFFLDIGLEVTEIFPFNEVIDELYSVNQLKIFNDKINQTLNDAIVVVMQIKR